MAQSVEQMLSTARRFRQGGEWARAEEIYRQILEREPGNAEALHLLGIVVFQLGRGDEGAELVRRAMAIEANRSDFPHSLGLILSNLGQTDAAIAAYRSALQLRPDFPEAIANLVVALKLKGDWEGLIDAYQKSIALNPGNAETWFRLGEAYIATQKMDPAIVACRKAIALSPNYIDAHVNLGMALKEIGLLDEALSCYQNARALAPERVELDSNYVYTLHFHPHFDSNYILAEHRKWDERNARPLRNRILPHGNDRSPDRRLRVGYVSNTFRNHTLCFFTIPLLGNHDHEQFEIFGYAEVEKEDEFTGQNRRYTDSWRNIWGMDDDRVAQMIREDGIDILVDLTMHMEHSRLLTFARKPAPVQITWLGYPSTTGLGTMDYRLTDPYLDPLNTRDEFYSEESIRLRDTFWCYHPLASRPVVNGLPALNSGVVTFGCLNNFCKVNDEQLKLWARVLNGVPGSRLMLLVPEGSARERVLRELSIDPSRIEFVPYQTRRKYLESYQRMDLGLDTFPYNGHTTSLDSLWMGVPVVTLVGENVVSRAGFSQTSNLGLTELVARTPEEFVRVAVELVGDLPRLSGLRGELRGRMTQSPLMDIKRFARSIESIYCEERHYRYSGFKCPGLGAL